MRKLAIIAALLPLAFSAQACPNAATSVTIPLSGTAVVALYDQACNVLPGGSTVVTYQGQTLIATTQPALTKDAAGLHFSSNGSAPGASGTLVVTYAGQTTNLAFVIGAPVTSISLGTTTP